MTARRTSDIPDNGNFISLGPEVKVAERSLSQPLTCNMSEGTGRHAAHPWAQRDPGPGSLTPPSHGEEPAHTWVSRPGSRAACSAWAPWGRGSGLHSRPQAAASSGTFASGTSWAVSWRLPGPPAPVPAQVSRGALTVRVGGGWVALDEYLVENDPERGGGAEPMGQGLVIPSRHTGSLLGTETPSLPRSRQGSHSVMEAASEDSLARQPQDRAAAQAAGPEAVSKAWTTKDTGQEGHLGRGQRLHQRPHGPPRAIKSRL
ncbi:uncharacterized protein LOC103004914 [Balaenoptera acutorostrata]|uniref:Uncharacterized protein LOC103004914 n=1 Tax=Balaenoptera acutorostrata TaxID=9767 RepID=A0A383YVT3_BALAC|nr:uncharacterized protein LOC103004914 [Balaenoptera acutorostrata]